MVTDMLLGVASFFAISKASEIAHSSASSISLFRLPLLLNIMGRSYKEPMQN